MWFLPDPNRLGVYVVICTAGFPLFNILFRLWRKKRITRGQVIEKVLLGSSAPSFVFLALSPLDHDLLTKVSDLQYYLCSCGVIGVAVSAFSLFDSDS